MHYLNYFNTWTLLLFIFMCTGCSSDATKGSRAETKLDAPLRMKLKEAGQSGAGASVQCLLKLKGALDESKKKVLNQTGITILSVLGEIITIEGDPEAIREVATLDFVHSMSLSQTRMPPEKQ